MGKSRYVVFATFMVMAVSLVLLSILYERDFLLVSFLCFALAAVTLVSAILDKHINERLRMCIMITGLLFVIAFAIGPLLTADNLPISIYCLIFAILEIINGIFEFNEAVDLIKEKNYVMGVLFAVDAIFEFVLGILMSIERHSTLRHHVILIAADLVFEGIIKLINEFVEEKKGIQHK